MTTVTSPPPPYTPKKFWIFALLWLENTMVCMSRPTTLHTLFKELCPLEISLIKLSSILSSPEKYWAHSFRTAPILNFWTHLSFKICGKFMCIAPRGHPQLRVAVEINKTFEIFDLAQKISNPFHFYLWKGTRSTVGIRTWVFAGPFLWKITSNIDLLSERSNCVGLIISVILGLSPFSFFVKFGGNSINDLHVQIYIATTCSVLTCILHPCAFLARQIHCFS